MHGDQKRRHKIFYSLFCAQISSCSCPFLRLSLEPALEFQEVASSSNSLCLSDTSLFPFLSPSLPKIPRCPYVEAQCYPVPLCQISTSVHCIPSPQHNSFSLFYVSFPWTHNFVTFRCTGWRDEMHGKDIRVSSFHQGFMSRHWVLGI